ncbi:MAG: glycine betaine/L-proline ABC transporter ATP-binding protein, partial [Thermomicrobiales bacterium]
QPAIKLACRKLWKVYGDKAAEVLARTNFAPTGEDLSTHGLVAALRDVSIDIQEGEVFVIMGLSGSGKSTLVRCLSLLIEPTAGQVLFEGRDLVKMAERELIWMRRHKMSMVFQHFALLPHLTVLENVAFPLEIQGVDKVKREARAAEMVELVGLKGREHNYPRELSGGQRQRVGIARSLTTEPEVWFLDEPFSALDPLIRRDLQNELQRLQGILRKSVVFITHDFDEAVRLADRIAILKDGAVEQIGTPEELLLSPATAYIAEFTKHIPRGRVLRAGTVMQANARNYDSTTRPVRQNDRIENVARQVLEADGLTPVIDEAGQIVGSLSRDMVMATLFPEP